MASRGRPGAIGPFLKWAGGKTQMLPHLEPFLPTEIASYREPFLGSGAVFFMLRSTGRLTGSVVLSDVNAEIVNAFRAVRDDVEALLCLLDEHRARHGSEHYYAVRAAGYRAGTDGAARTIYLNKTGYNGLYRVNRRGEFNVPMGRYHSPSVYDADALRRASAALQGVRVEVACFRDVLAAAGEGDFLYLDPPYVPLSASAAFTHYAPGGFGPGDQEALAALVREAAGRGVRFLLSNSYTDEVLRLYAGFRIERAPSRRAINSAGDRRGPVWEAMVMNSDGVSPARTDKEQP